MINIIKYILKNAFYNIIGDVKMSYTRVVNDSWEGSIDDTTILYVHVMYPHQKSTREVQ